MGNIDRAENDWYMDQPEATEALLRAEPFSGLSWDPACGAGTIPSTMRAFNLTCLGSDLVDRGYERASLRNFLGEREDGDEVANIVCNPPFSLARAFVDKALLVATHKVAMLLPLTFLEGQRKAYWLPTTPLARVHIFTWRISMPPGELLLAGKVKPEGGKKCFAWFVWEHGHVGPWSGRLLIKTNAKAASGSDKGRAA